MNTQHVGSWKRTAVLAVAALLPVCSSQATLVLDYSNQEGASIRFNGNSTFQFNPSVVAGGEQWEISSSGSAQGFLGDFGNTVWYFNPGTRAVSPVGGGTPTFTIIDGAAQKLQAEFAWATIATMGAAGGLNYEWTVNVKNISYAGSDEQLVALKNAGSAILDLTFQVPFRTGLTYLSKNVYETSYSGTLTAVPEASTVLAGLGALGMLTWASLRRRDA